MVAKTSRMQVSLEGMMGSVPHITVWTDYRAFCWGGAFKVGQFASNYIMGLSQICK